MKKINTVFIIILMIIIIIIYANSLKYFGNNEQTIVNNPVSTLATERPRLEDDFYGYVNYQYLSEDKLNNEWMNYYTDQTDKIEDEKEKIIDELLTKNNSTSKKINVLYNTYTENTEQKSLNELNKYIEIINNSKDIEDFVKKVIDINFELSTDILVSPNIIYNPKGESQKYFGFDLITYDWDNTIGYYSLPTEYEAIVRMYKKYDIELLKLYGYSAEDAVNIADNVQEMYKKFSMFSEINQNKLLDKGFKVYNIDELQNQLQNLNLGYIVSYYPEFYNSKDGILVVDINQLKSVDEYLKEENLDTLKNYATLKILTTYAPYIDESYYNIYMNYIYESQNYIETKEYTKKDIGYKQIYDFFKDTITEEFAKKHFTEEQKNFYENLIKEEIEAYKKRIMQEDWLSDKTKEKALTKMEKMKYTVGISDELVKVENKYIIDANSSYMKNIINIKKTIKKEEMTQYKKGNIMYNRPEVDQLMFNAFYTPYNNSMNLLLGYIYSLTESLDLGYTDLENNYYKILGSIGATIGHELSHSLDTMGSKYDENGNYINWWTEEDADNFNSKTSKVIKYYNKYEQFGNTTIGENIADLGGVAIVLQIANSKNAEQKDYKDIFETYAKDFASQTTSIMREYLLNNDVHSPNKNRVNAVLSTLDKFYEVYNIKNTDQMYVLKEHRVSVW